jgi:hypothetical protein
MTYSMFACAVIGNDRTENTLSLLLFPGRSLVTAVVYQLIQLREIVIKRCSSS